LLTVLMMSLPAAIVIAFGEMISNRRQAWVLYAIMAAMLFMLLPLAVIPEQLGTMTLARAGVETAPTASQEGGNMEGKEVRFGITASSLFSRSSRPLSRPVSRPAA
jgi:potassium-transporting ATPase potassium-binding subunit